MRKPAGAPRHLEPLDGSGRAPTATPEPPAAAQGVADSVQRAIVELYAVADWAEEIGDLVLAELALTSVLRLRRKLPLISNKGASR